jgi:hypothetical protein
MRYAWFLAISLGLLGLSLGIPACEAGLDGGLEGKKCGSADECVAGYECDPSSKICVLLGSIKPSGSGTGAAGGDSTSSGQGASAGAGGCPGAGGCTAECGSGETNCNGKCIKLPTDPEHCGACDKPCPVPAGGAATCADSKCGVDCNPGLNECSGGCYDFLSEPEHCGDCETVCNTDQVCTATGCATTCPDGFTNCGKACVDVQSNAQNCGGCDKPCAAPANGLALCADGMCDYTCAGSDFPDKCAPGGCVNQQTDAEHCGDCDAPCAAPVSGEATGAAVCEAATCGATCGAATPTECDVTGGKACVDVQKDSQHCGSCATGCAPGTQCGAGTCKATCGPGLTKCGNQCVNLKTDPTSCGMCNNACPEGVLGVGAAPACSDGVCLTACGGGLTACGVGLVKKACVDKNKDPENCGACGTQCSDGQLCIAGKCKAFLYASGCWECGADNPQCCMLAGQTVCASGDACP